MNWIDLAQQGQVTGSFDCSNELSGSIKYKEFLD